MDSIKQTITELSAHFTTRMDEFQRNIQSPNPSTGLAPNIATQFVSFRSFVMAALEGLHMQVNLLYKSSDEMEMRSRRKMLLLHGVPESKEENVGCVAAKVFENHLKIPVSLDSISRCQRLGRTKTDKPRPVLIKLHDLTLRNELWFAKTGLKNSGITLSEFLTKERHVVFMAARQRFGVNRCWTRDGHIFVVGHDGSRHRVRSTAELDSISASTPGPSVSASAAMLPKNTGTSRVPTGPSGISTGPVSVRPKRAGKK